MFITQQFMLRIPRRSICTQRLYSQCVRYKWMHQEAQPIATLRKPNGGGNHAVNVSAATRNQSNEVTSFLQIIPVSIQSSDNRLEQSFNQLRFPPNKSFNLMEVGITQWQEAYELQRPLYYRIGTRREHLVVQREPEWVVSGHMTRKGRENDCHFAFTKDMTLDANIQTWWDIELYTLKINVVSQSMKEMQAQKLIESTTKFTSERLEVGML